MTTERGDRRRRGTGPDGAELDRPEEVGAGTWFHNPATGEIARLRVGPAETDGQRIEVDLWLQPGAAVAGAHRHAHIVERFEVLAGHVAFRIGDAERHVGRGDGIMEVAPGPCTTGGTQATRRPRCGSTSRRRRVLPAGRPLRGRDRGALVARRAGRGQRQGHVRSALARGDRPRVPRRHPLLPTAAVVQAALFAPLAALARRTGRNPLAPELHGPLAPCVIADPGEDGLARLLARPVQTRVARGRA